MKKQQGVQTAGIYLLLGENNFEKEEFLRRLILDFSKGKSVSLISIDYSEDQAIHKFIAELRTSSLFTSYKIVLLKNLDKPMTRQERELIVELLGSFYSNEILVVIISSLSPYKFDKTVSTLIEGKGGVVKAFWKISQSELPNYVLNLLSKSGVETSKELVKVLIERNGQNINGIIEDIKYVRGYFSNVDYISAAKFIEVLMEKYGEGSIFDLVNAVIKGDKHRVIMLIRHLIERGEDLFLLGTLLYSQLYKIIRIKRYLEVQTSDEEISKQLEMSVYEVRNLKDLVKYVDNRRAKRLLEFIVEFEIFVRNFNDISKVSGIESYILNNL
ncbi:MAG: DNA polymerase III subunit delta [Brevinematales bacterium]|nr:DNA polymerase III subunit delta [Brevinematales bacterium]